MKKVLSLIIALIVVSGFFSYSLAEGSTELDIVEKSSETKQLENDQGYISKTIVDSNSETGEVTIELKLQNVKNSVKEKSIVDGAEIFLVIDKSGSMSYEALDGKKRGEVIREASKELVNNLYDEYNNIEVGVITFSSSSSVECKLTSKKDDVINSIDSIRFPVYGSTNLKAGLKSAKDNFSKDCENKIVIVLTDGLPTAGIVDADEKDEVKDLTRAEKYAVVSKNELTELDADGINTITMLTKIKADDGEDQEESEALVKKIFGTQESPTVGKFYYIDDADIGKVVTNDISSDVSEILSGLKMENVKIVDYFPSDIMENFDFSYVGDPSIGTISPSIDNETKTISWDVSSLEYGNTATVKYKLKLKDMNNEKLIDRVIATNEKVVLTYEVDKEYTVVLDSSPKIKLSKKVEVNTEKQDDSVSPNILAKTGEFRYIFGAIIIAGIVFVAYRRYKRIKF